MTTYDAKLHCVAYCFPRLIGLLLVERRLTNQLFRRLHRACLRAYRRDENESMNILIQKIISHRVIMWLHVKLHLITQCQYTRDGVHTVFSTPSSPAHMESRTPQERGSTASPRHIHHQLFGRCLARSYVRQGLDRARICMSQQCYNCDPES